MHIQDHHGEAPQGVAAELFTRQEFIHQDSVRQAYSSRDYPVQSFARAGLANRDAIQQGFTTEDILWAVGIWSAIICLSPVILFYMLMVA